MSDYLKAGKTIMGALAKAKEMAKAAPQEEALALAQKRAAAGRKAADVTKATAPMKLSEALGNMNQIGRAHV